MNKIFRIVWSYATQSWVVVSELTKAHKKQSSSNSLKAALGAVTVLLSINSAEAVVLIGAADGNTISANGSTAPSSGIVIGGDISKAAAESVIIGDKSGSVGSRNVVIGTYATAGYDEHKPADNPPKEGAFNQSVAIGAGRSAGEGARAYGDQSIAIGSNTIAIGNSSIAIGNDDVDKTGSTNTTYTDLNGQTKTGSIANAYNELTGQDLGVLQYQDTTSKEAAVAIGVKSVAGDISLALGTAARADKVNAVAIGTGATANRDNAVAIGGGSTTDAAATSELKTIVNGLTFNWAGGERTISGDVVSFGKEGYERQLKHVSPGKVSATSTDAINGSQLYGVLNHLTSDPVYFYGADDSSDAKVAGDDAAKKSADAKDKKIVARSMADSRLNLKGGATGELTDNNIGVKYEDEGTIRFKLAKALSGLTSAEFKDANNNVVNITPTGVSVKKPNATDANTVTLSQNGLNNGGNAITNVAGNLEGSKLNSAAPTTNATAPNNVDDIKNNAATVGDVLQAGWNLQNNDVAKDLVKPYDTVNFINGEGTTAVVETTTNNTTSKIKYNVNTGNGLEKDTATNKIQVKAADSSLVVDTNGVKVNTGTINTTSTGTAAPNTGDEDKVATVNTVVNAINNAAFTLKASADGGTRNGNSTVKANGEPIKAGSTIEMIAGKNLDVKHDKSGKITFATVDNPSFSTVQVGDDQGPKFSGTSDGNIKVSGSNDTDPVKITNVKDGEISANSKDAINGSQFHKVANNTIKLAGQNGDDTATATETNAQNLNKQGGIKFTVKSSNGDLLDVTAAEDTVTLTPKIAKIITGKDGVPTANTSGGKLVTADDLVKALKDMGWKATADKDGTGTVEEGNAEELIKAGNTVTFKAGNNLAVKQAGKEFIYSLQKELTGLTSAEFKGTGTNAPTTKLTNEGVTITPETSTGKNPVSLTQNGLNNGGNAITDVAGNLDGAKANTQAPTTNAAAPNTTNKDGDKYVNPNNAATVGDVLNAGWNLQEKGTAKDFVTAYDTVNFIDGEGTSVSVENTDNKTSKIKYSVNLGDGLEKTNDNKIKAKAGDGVTVGTDGIKVNTGKGLKIDATDGNKVAVNTDGTTITVDNDGKVKAETGSTEVVTADNKTGTEKVGQVRPVATDKDKLATVDTVAQAVNSAKWIAKATNTDAEIADNEKTDDSTKAGEGIAAGDEVTFTAGKNLRVKREGKNFTFATDKNVSFDSVKVGDTQNGKAPVNLTTEGATTANNNEAGKAPTTALNISSGTGTDAKPTQLVGVGSVLNKTTFDTTPTGTVPAGGTPTTEDLVNLNEAVNKNAAATVGDLQNMGWKVSSDKATGAEGAYLDVVKNANEVRFVGEGTAIVSGKTDATTGVRTITVKVDDQVSTNNAVKPVEYTKADGTKVYPTDKKDAQGNPLFNTKADGTGTEVPSDQVITSINGPKGTTSPTTLANVKNNIPNVNDGTEEITTADGTVKPKAADKANINKAPLTAEDAAKLVNSKNADGTVNPNYIGNNAATVSDVLNAGWNLQNNGTAKDFVKPYDTVNFINGLGTTAVVTTREGSTVSDVTFNVKPANGSVTVGEDGVKVTTGEIISNTNGSVAGPTTPENAKTLKDALDAAVKELATAKDALKTAETALAVNPNDATLKQDVEAKKADVAAKQTSVNDAQKAHDDAGLNKVATVQNVAEAINNSGFNLKTSAATGGEKLKGTKNDGELIKPSNTVEMVAGKNLTVKQDENGKVTYATKDDVEFNTVKVGADDKTANGKKPVNLTTEAAKGASNNDDANKPTTALNISSGTGTDAKPTQLVGVGSVLNKTTFDTTPTGTVPAGGTPTTEDLVNLNEAVNKNAAATVGDLQNMGWKVSSDKATGAEGAYLDVVKNANEVKFVGKNAAKVSGKTENGVRTITIDVPDVKTAELVSSKDGSVIAPSTDSKLQEALKAAKDELAALPKDATPEKKKEVEEKVKDA